VDDLDGTVAEERIGHDAGATSPQALTLSDIVTLISNAGKVPTERDTLYSPLRTFAAGTVE
jgi:aminodeoxyfutalosine synthase